METEAVEATSDLVQVVTMLEPALFVLAFCLGLAAIVWAMSRGED